MPKNKRAKKKNARKKSKKSVPRNIPAAQSSQNRSKFQTQSLSGSSVRVRGYDLVYASDEDSSVAEGAFCVIPCNPAYWTGTRVARIATAYSQYRPLRFNVHYFPQVSTMTNGLVTAGTIWNNDTNPEAIQQALATSNSGKIYPVYTKSSHYVDLKTCLQQNLFSFSGYLSHETNPFLFLALTQHYEGNAPGYYMVEYEYDFKNPIGEGAEFDTETRQVGEITNDDVWENTTAVLMTSSLALSIGTTLIVKLVEGAIQFFLDGSKLGMAANLVVKLFKSRTPNSQSIIKDIEHNILVSFESQVTAHINGEGVNSSFVIPNVYLSNLVQVLPTEGYYAWGVVVIAPTQISGDGVIPLFTATILRGITPDGWPQLPDEYSYYTLTNGEKTALVTSRNSGDFSLPACIFGIQFSPSPLVSAVMMSNSQTIHFGDIFIPPIEPSPTRIVGNGSRKVLSRQEALSSKVYEVACLESKSLSRPRY